MRSLVSLTSLWQSQMNIRLSICGRIMCSRCVILSNNGSNWFISSKFLIYFHWRCRKWWIRNWKREREASHFQLFRTSVHSDHSFCQDVSDSFPTPPFPSPPPFSSSPHCPLICSSLDILLFFLLQFLLFSSTSIHFVLSHFNSLSSREFSNIFVIPKVRFSQIFLFSVLWCDYISNLYVPVFRYF